MAPLDHLWFKPGQPLIELSVGRLNVLKDCGKLLQMFKNVEEQRSSRLLILGDDEEQQMLGKMNVELGLTDDVSWPRFADNTYACMSNAAVDALSSCWEELPIVLVEAHYCGIPLVPTDSQEFLQGGKFGCIVPTQDPYALAANIVGALDGTTPRAEPDSWQRFEFENIVGQNIDLLLTDKRT